jgi:cell wall-associated NlpC family hydrolase
MILSETVKAKFVEQAKAECPREACGLVIIKNGKQVYCPAKNLAKGSDNFILDPLDYEKADTAGEIVAVIHSHPNMSAKPSQADLVACEGSGLPWFICGIPSEQWEYIEPSGYIAPLVGRQWSHGVLDCYAIIRDWYAQEKNITLLDFERSDEWWKMGGNLYLDNFEKAGFKRITLEELSCGDVILMTVNSTVPNHGAIYLGDNMILHHVHGRLSTRDIFGGYWLKNAMVYLRYEKNTATR